MIPNLDKAARAAADASGSSRPDPLRILQSLPNVLLIAFESSAGVLSGQDSMTLVEKRNGFLHYIVLYNSGLPPYQLRRALARELGHVVLRHDGSDPEYVWSEEADCFAFHFLARPAVEIRYRPLYDSVSRSFKDMRVFSSISDLKHAIAEERTRFSHYVGKPVFYTSDDVQISALDDPDYFAGWNNYSSVSIAGRPVGFCGE